MHSVLLRSGCMLPDRLNPCVQQPIGHQWSIVEEIPALVFDSMIRQAGWHFIWLQGACSRRGIGLTHEGAISRALLRALNGIPKQINAAELDSVQITQFPGFQIAKVTVQPIQIQKDGSINSVAGLTSQPIPAT